MLGEWLMAVLVPLLLRAHTWCISSLSISLKSLVICNNLQSCRGFRRITRGPDRDSYYHEVNS